MWSTVIGFNVAQLLKAPIGTVRRVEVNEVDPDLARELRQVSPTVGSLRLMRTAAGILVTGQLSHQVEVDCSRCLEPFVRTQVLELNDEFVPVVDVYTGVPLPLEESVEEFQLTPEHILDLTEAIRELAILESPLAPLCRPDCQGLCSDCGANLNQGACGCQQKSSDTRQEGFGALLAQRIREAGFRPEQE